MRKEPDRLTLHIAAKLKSARGNRSAKDVSFLTGGYVQPRMVHNYEHGTLVPLPVLVVLAAALGIAIEDLLTKEILTAVKRKDVNLTTYLLGN